jgi:hypothetical protein
MRQLYLRAKRSMIALNFGSFTFSAACEAESHLSFPKIPSARIRALRQNQSIILGDACMPSAA